MKKKHWFPAALYAQSYVESDSNLSSLMKSVANRIHTCGSRTIFDVANMGYFARCQKAKEAGEDYFKIMPPDCEEYVEWVGEVGGKDAALRTLGLARCKRIQCPACCYTRSLLRRTLALEWAEKKDWNDYYAVSLTFTVPHSLWDSETPRRFKKVMDNLFKSASNFSSWVSNILSPKRDGYRSDAPESVGFISSLEFTFGKNGLHPHFHTLFLTKSKRDVEALKKWFRRDRNRVKAASKEKKQMPRQNEDLSFKELVKPHENANMERVLAYINKGLFETMSHITKDKGKTVFHLNRSDLKYFCTFFEATKGKRFYRSGGVCKEIKTIKDVEKNDIDTSEILKKNLNRLVRISGKDLDLPPGRVSDFVKKHQQELEEKAVDMTASDIKKMVEKAIFEYEKSRVNLLGKLLKIEVS